MLDAFGVERTDISKGFKSPRMVARYLGNIAGETTGRATKEVEDSGARLMQDFERRATRTAIKVGAASAGAGVVGTAGATYANKKIRNYKGKAPVSKGLPSYLKQVKAGKAILPNRQENQVAQWKLDANKSGNAARKAVSRKDYSSAGNNMLAGKQTAAFSKLPRTGGMVERTGYPGNGWIGSQASRKLRNADKGGFKTQLAGR